MSTRQRPHAVAGAELSTHENPVAQLQLAAIEPKSAGLAEDIVIVDADIAAGHVPERDIGIPRVEKVGPGRHRPETVISSRVEEKSARAETDCAFVSPIFRSRLR